MSTAPAKLRIRKGEARWSQACKCPRMAVYGLRGAPEQLPFPNAERYRERGKLDGEFVARQFEQRYPGGVIREKAVLWGAGELHTDVFVIPEAAAFEVKSSRSPGPILEDAIIQNAGEQHFDPDADKGGVILIDPVSLDERVIPVVMNTELQERVETIAAQVVAAGKDGPLPERVCSTPADAVAKMCPFAETCFADWEAPPAISLDGVHATLVAELAHAERECKSRKGAVDEITKRRDELRAELRPVLEPGRDYELEGVHLKRTVIEPRVTYDVNAALLGGSLSEDQVAPFRKIGKESERWTVDSRGAVPAPAPDYGDVPF